MHQNPLLTIRYNVTNISSISEFAGVRNGWNGDCKDVCFLRMVGKNSCYETEVEQMDQSLAKQMLKGQLTYSRPDSLPMLSLREDAEYYAGCFDRWINTGRKIMKTRLTADNQALSCVLGEGCARTADLFRQVTPHANGSIEKNFVAKLLFWLDQTGKDLLEDWRPGFSAKFVLANLSKKQEYLFAYLLTCLGIDVLLLQYQSDIDPQLDRMQLSRKVTLGSFDNNGLKAFDIQRYKNTPPAASGAPGTGQTVPTGTPRIASSDLRRRDRPARAMPAGARQEMAFEELAQLASSVVMISVLDDRGQVLGTGSGIMVGEAGYILTNCHVANKGRFYGVQIEEDDTIYRTDEMIKYNSVLDLAVIRIDRRLKPLPIYKGEKKLVRGQKVVAIGSPLGLFNSVSDGIISGFRVIGDVDMIQFTAPISHGSSGGALLNMFGEVIGISTAGMDDGQNINLAVGYECISQFIRGFT